MDQQLSLTGRIYGMMKEKGITLEDLSQKSGISVVTWRDKFKGRAPLKQNDIQFLAEVFGFTDSKAAWDFFFNHLG